MGDWAVLTAWNGGNGFHDWHARGRASDSEPGTTTPWTAEQIFGFHCYPVIKEHQATPEEVSEVPEFTIAVSWNIGNIASFVADGRPSAQMGWKWSICWTGRDGGRKMRTGYGFGTPDTAKKAAEDAAKKVARGHFEEVYTYTPEI